MFWMKKKEICSVCNQNKTKKALNGVPVCWECQIDYEMKRESIRVCPCGEKMKKEYLKEAEIIIDRCSGCGGVFLDKEELGTIFEALDSDNATQFATGLALGISI